ncbi:hypothetical protein HDU91_004311 [Kappamyces sp. JEL0680]|nr:hypothetical protein HDU91_004311 [Kappamyces sp. JEL0680]
MQERIDHDNGKDSATSPLQVQEMPDQVASTLSHIVRQIDILTQTMSILESRLTINEDRMLDIAQKLDAGAKGKNASLPSPSALDHVYFEDQTAEELYQS